LNIKGCKEGQEICTEIKEHKNLENVQRLNEVIENICTYSPTVINLRKKTSLVAALFLEPDMIATENDCEDVEDPGSRTHQ